MARIGTVGYLNARPLRDRIDVDRHTVVLAHPAEVARMLEAGEVEVALAPVAAVIGRPELRVVPGVCIGAEGPVASVVLAAETPPETWTAVRLDGVSRTSVVLAELLLRRGPLAGRVRADLEIVHTRAVDGLSGAGGTVAALVIGESARTLDPRWTARVDLAEQWTAWTGLPFVFAVWAGRVDLDPAVVRHVREAGEAGVAAIPEVHAGDDLQYLTKHLRYALDDRALMGVRRFAALAHEEGLLPDGTIELFGPPARLERRDVDALLARAVDDGDLGTEEIGILLREAPLAELAAAAHLVRCEVGPSGEVGYRVDDLESAVHVRASDPDVVDRLLAMRGTVREVELLSGTASGAEHLRLVAVARLVLRDVRLVVPPRVEGLGAMQVALHAGADHAGAVGRRGDPGGSRVWITAVERQIREAGFVPVEDRTTV